MACEAYVPLFDEYVDGELRGRDAEQLTAHLAVCTSCAEEVRSLVHEQQIYASYQRNIEITPDLWQGVRARIENEKQSPSSPSPAWKTWFVDTFRSRFVLRPGFAVALVLIVLGIATLAVVKFRNSQDTSQTVAGRDNRPSEILAPSAPVVVPTNNYQRPTETPPTDNSNVETGVKEKIRTLATAKTKPTVNNRKKELTLDDASRIAEIAADRNNNARRPLDSPQIGIARHVEQSEMLLRSFRNVRLAEANHAPDISYEKGQSRKLLYRNIILRRDAAAQGDVVTERLLDTLEPILLDIANMPNRPTDSDVRAIDQRMRKKDIMTALQVHSIVAQNSF
jgi:ribosome-binding protein aMBF1 (putative translation factor)